MAISPRKKTASKSSIISMEMMNGTSGLRILPVASRSFISMGVEENDSATATSAAVWAGKPSAASAA